MASSVFYKFKSQRDESRVTFDGTGISVFDLKKEIIIANNLGKANDFDLVVQGTSGEDYKDDAQVIPRSSSVVVRRVPARPGKGSAARYLGNAGPVQGSSDSGPKNGGGGWHRGGGNISKRFDKETKEEPKQAERPPPPPMPLASSVVTEEDEAAAMAAMFQAQTANWEEAQEKMSHATRVYNNPRGTAPRGGKPFQPSHHQSERPLPPSYVCYRCGQKGHWIQDCPTNNDREFDNRPRIKRTTGIPRSFLKAVDNPTTGPLGQGVMVTPEGGYVVAQPDSASWQKQVSRHKGLTEADIRDRAPTDPSLACPIDGKLIRDAVKTPCCGTLYCEDCVQTHLLERDFLCPNCVRKIPSLDKLIVDKPMRARVHEYVDAEIERSKQEAERAEKQEREKAAEDSKASAAEASGGGAEGEKNGAADASLAVDGDEGFYGEGFGGDVSQWLTQLQAQSQQLQVMLNNPALPGHVRQQAQMKQQQLQLEMQQAQIAATMQQAAQQQQSFIGAAMGAGGMGVGAGMGAGMGTGAVMGAGQAMGEYRQWTNPFPNQQPTGQDSAYQRLPVNNRRRNLKRDRPSDFLEVGGAQNDAKAPRYWE